MNCKQAKQEFSATPAPDNPRSTELREHLEDCAACREEQQILMETDQNLRNGAAQLLAATRLPDGFHEQLMKSLQASVALPPCPAPIKWKAWLAIAAIFLLLLTGIFLLAPQGDRQPLPDRLGIEPELLVLPSAAPATGTLLPSIDQHFASLDLAVNAHTNMVFARETENIRHDLQSVGSFLRGTLD